MRLKRRDVEKFVEDLLSEKFIENSDIKNVTYKFSKGFSRTSGQPKSIDIKVYFND